MSTTVATRADLLSLLGPRGWYIDHVAQLGTLSTDVVRCGCDPDRPSPICDLGEALHRLAESEKSGKTRRGLG